jgi:transcriptional regulator with XRE-family HTH domain
LTTVVFSAIWELFLAESGDIDQNLLVLGLTVRRLREQRDASVEELARACDVDDERIEAIESGRLDPTYELLLALAEGLGVEASALVRLSEELRESKDR